MKRFLYILLLSMTCSSCSTYTVTKLDERNCHDVKGLRFFQPKPFLLVAEKDILVDGIKTVKESNGSKTTTMEKMAVARKELLCSVIYLPDPQKEYSIETSHNSSVQVRLEDGWRLTGLNLGQGSETMTTSQVSQLSGTQGLSPGVYAIEFDGKNPILKKVEIIK